MIGKPEILKQPEFATHEARSQNYNRAYAMVSDELKKRTTDEWVAAFERADKGIDGTGFDQRPLLVPQRKLGQPRVLRSDDVATLG